MRHIVFVLIATFVQLVKSQTCESARNNFDFQCAAILNTADPSVCTGSCSIQLTTLKTACENSVSLIQYSYIVVTNRTIVQRISATPSWLRYTRKQLYRSVRYVLHFNTVKHHFAIIVMHRSTMCMLLQLRAWHGLHQFS